MEFIIAESTEDMSRRAADRIASFVEADQIGRAHV